MPIVFGLPWRHPAVILFFLIIVIGTIEVCLEFLTPLSTNGSAAHRGAVYFLLSIVGIVVWAYIVLHVICFPEEYLPKRSLTMDSDFYERREAFVRCIGYVAGVSSIIFIVDHVVLMCKAI